MLIDAIIFNGEWDILELRIAELEGVVDKFVIVESAEYHGSYGRKEPRVYGYQYPGVDIKYVWLDHLEPAFDGSNSWARENYHRNCLMRHVVEASSSSSDMLMLSDCDEIPRAEMVGAIPTADKLYGTCQDFFYYNVNTYGGEWHGTVIGTIDAFYHAGGLQAAREKRDSLPLIPNAGWHFSYFGGLPRIREKMRNFAHAHEDTIKLAVARSDEEIADDIRNMRDLYHRPEMAFTHRSSDDYRLPKYFLENKEKFPLWTT